MGWNLRLEKCSWMKSVILSSFLNPVACNQHIYNDEWSLVPGAQWLEERWHNVIMDALLCKRSSAQPMRKTNILCDISDGWMEVIIQIRNLYPRICINGILINTRMSLSFIIFESTCTTFLVGCYKNVCLCLQLEVIPVICHLEGKAKVFSTFYVNGISNLSHKFNVC